MSGIDIRTFSYSGAVSFDSTLMPAALPDHIAHCLREADASLVEVHHDCVTFKANPFRLNARPLRALRLLPFDFGNLTVDLGAREIAYRVSFKHVAIASTVMVAAMWLAPLFIASFLNLGSVTSAFTWRSFTEAVALTVVWWVLTVGGSLLLGIPSFARFIRGVITAAPRLAQPHDLTR